MLKAISGVVTAGILAAAFAYGCSKRPDEPVVAAAEPQSVSAGPVLRDVAGSAGPASGVDSSALPVPKEAPAGAWIFKESESAALFGPPNTEAILTVRCEGGKLRIVQNGQQEQAGGITVGLSSGSVTLTHVSSTAGMPTSAGEIDLKDAGVDRLVAETGSYVIRAGSLPPIRLPATEMIRRVVESCL